MIKLTKHQSNGDQVLRIDGSLSADTVGELRRMVGGEHGGVLTLDLDGLTSVDPEGRSLLVHLRDQGHRLHGGSLYIRRLLEEGQS